MCPLHAPLRGCVRELSVASACTVGWCPYESSEVFFLAMRASPTPTTLSMSSVPTASRGVHIAGPSDGWTLRRRKYIAERAKNQTTRTTRDELTHKLNPQRSGKNREQTCQLRVKTQKCTKIYTDTDSIIQCNERRNAQEHLDLLSLHLCGGVLYTRN